MTPTRFPELMLDRVSARDWRFADAETRAHVGAVYRSKAEALADLERYHAEAWAGRLAPEPHRFASVLSEFPTFDLSTLPEIPPGFADQSWGNDVCPSFANPELGLSVWVDFADPAARELEIPRFAVYECDADGGRAGDHALASSDDWADVEALILSRAFLAVLAEWLTEEEMAEVRRRNAAREPDDASCSSHDFCDANMAMLEAFTESLGREPRVYDVSPTQEGPDVALWNAAWRLAMPHNPETTEKA